MTHPVHIIRSGIAAFSVVLSLGLWGCAHQPIARYDWVQVNSSADKISCTPHSEYASGFIADVSPSAREKPRSSSGVLTTPRDQWVDKSTVNNHVDQNTELHQERVQVLNISAMSSEEVSEVWPIQAGQTLHEVIEDWSRTAHWEYRYQLSDEWKLQSSLQIHGSFESAVNQLERKLIQQDVPIAFYLNEKNHFLLISDSHSK